MPDLPADREAALAAIARGWGREATLAHPLCACLVTVEACRHDHSPALLPAARCPTARKECPMHGPKR